MHNGKSYTKLLQPSLWSPYPHVYVTKVECTVLIRQAWRERRPIRGEMGLSLRNFQNERERVGKLTIVLFSQTHLKININTQKVLMGDGFIKTEPHK